LTPVVPTEKDEYRLEEQGTWAHELKWQRRALANDPAWYFNRLVAFCALWWLLSLVPGAFAAFEGAASVLVLSLALAASWMQYFMQHFMQHIELLSVSAQTRICSFCLTT
jgi:hypothetical protein